MRGVMPTVELVGRIYVIPPPLLIGIARPVVLVRALRGDKLNAAVLVGHRPCETKLKEVSHAPIRRRIRPAHAEEERSFLSRHGTPWGEGLAGSRGLGIPRMRRRRPQCEDGAVVP